MSARDIFEDFTKLARNVQCSCSQSLRRVIWQFKMDDVLKSARGFRDPVVLAVEFRDGPRLFMVTSRSHVFHYVCYLRIYRPGYPTWHEIVSGLTPQRLYFDIEFYKQSNPGLDTRYLLRDFRKLITELLFQYFQWRCGEEPNLHFLDLDATTEEKFSHHLIVRMRYDDGHGTEVIFKDVAEIHDFVHERVLPALAERNRRGFYVRPKPGLSNNGENVPLIDMGVYKLKQNFRVLGSPKFGRQNVLRLVNPSNGRHYFDFDDPDCEDCYLTFRECLVTACTLQIRTGDPPNLKMVVGGQHLMTKLNLIMYRREIASTGKPITHYSYPNFCYEIRQFITASRLFEPELHKKLLTDLVLAMKRSEFFDQFSPDALGHRNIRSIVDIFGNFKNAMLRDPVDWDVIHEITAKLLEHFEDYPRDDDCDLTSEESELHSRMNADPNTIRRLRTVYRQFVQLQKQSPSNFFAQYYAKAKELYDACMVKLLDSDRSVIPPNYPEYLHRNNFRHVFELLADLERWELERRALRKSRAERKASERIEKVRHRLEEERNYLRMLNDLFDNEYRTWMEDRKKRLRYAIDHVTHLVQDYERRANEAVVGRQAFVMAIMAVETIDQESD